MRIYAHRGFSGVYPENTMLAFQKALEAGADGIELDVHLSSDGKPVIIHDELLVRTTGEKGIVSDYLLKELTGMQATHTRHEAFDACIPSFEEYCEFAAANNLVTNIEIKTNNIWYQDIEKKLIEMVMAFHIEERIIFSSFNWLSVMKAKILAPQIPCALLYEGETSVRHIALQAKSLGIQYLHPDFKLLDDHTVSECRTSGIGLNVWTVDNENRLSALLQWNVDGVITNFPDRCSQFLSKL